MPSLSDYKRQLSDNGSYIGQVQKKNSDMIMEQTWDRDIQSKKCYIYDFFHDDQPWLNEGMTYENTTKTLIYAKFIVTQSQSLEKDRVSVMLQFKPSEKLRFDESDELYYYETNYKSRYNSDFPCGMYCDIPDDNNVYHKWIICAKEIDNQFTKYLILPANYRFSWIEISGNKRIIRRVWGSTRSQNSYNSGLWTAYYSTEVENQFKAILPMNSITEEIFYVDGSNQNQRFVISAMTKNPRTWQVSKFEDMLMGDFGLIRLTFAQVAFNRSTDFIDYDAINPDGSKDVFAMYANYYNSIVEPIEIITNPTNSCVLSASTGVIKAGGSYKTITVNFYDEKGIDVTDKYMENISIDNWEFYIDEKNVSNENVISVLQHADKNKIKIRFAKNDEYLSKALIVKFKNQEVYGELYLEIAKL